LVKRKAELRIGISGWRYPPWRGVFYPEKLPQAKELAFASRQVNSIEINGSFYSLQKPSSYNLWYKSVPDDFLFSVKGPRYITHIKMLKDVDTPLANFFASGVLCLKEKLGPILWQFPPRMKFDLERFKNFIAMLPRDTKAAAKLAKKHDKWMKARSYTRADGNRPLRHAIEVRNASFVSPDFIKLLRREKIALVTADTAGKWPFFDEPTTDFIYARLHGDQEIYISGYDESALAQWAERIRNWQSPKRRDVYLYFDNDVKVRAPFDAITLQQKLADLSPGHPESG